MHLIMLKYNGNLPSSDNTAMLVVLLCTPRMNLQNFKCIFSHNDPEYILSKNGFSFLHFIVNGLNMPQISLSYIKIGLIVWSNTCMLVLIFGLSDSRSFFNLKNAFRYFLYNSF